MFCAGLNIDEKEFASLPFTAMTRVHPPPSVVMSQYAWNAAFPPFPSGSTRYVPLAVDHAVFAARQLVGVGALATFEEVVHSTNAPVELDDFGSFTSPATEPEEAA